MDERLLDLLMLSQVVLSFQLPFAIVPLVHFTSDRRRMGEFASRGWLKTLAWTCAIIVVSLNAVLIYIQIGKWADAAATGGWNPIWVYGPGCVLAVALAGFLGWVTLYPSWVRHEAAPRPAPIPALPAVRFQRIGVAVEFERSDDAVLSQAATLARAAGASLVLIHVVEGLGAAFYGSDTDDLESRADRAAWPGWPSTCARKVWRCRASSATATRRKNWYAWPGRNGSTCWSSARTATASSPT